jgi:anti-sigma regulatory factor (Ser/Thr protein kinase)
MGMPSRQFTFRFPASLVYLTALRQIVEAFCTEMLESEPREEQIYQMQLAVSELTTNIIVHANKRNADAVVEVVGQSGDGNLALDFYDWGVAYAMKTPTLPDPESLAEGGYGSYIIQQCVDSVSYERDGDGRNHWRLEKAFGSKGGT